jgi:DNA-binding Xre family transcriptional regulator
MLSFSPLFELLKQRHISQKELALKAGLHPTTISRLRHLSGLSMPKYARTFPNCQILEKICIALGCQISDIACIETPCESVCFDA